MRGAVRTALANAIEAGAPVVAVDFADAERLDWPVAVALGQARFAADAAGVRLCMVGISPALRPIIEATGLDVLIEEYATVDEAVAETLDAGLDEHEVPERIA
jgi:anti-anti-sigma regulatory factor